MNAYTMAVDPHSNYMVPRSAEEFDVQMSLSLVGIGATMTERNGYNTVEDLNAKGPAKLSGKLHIGDRLVGVAQAAGQPFVDVRGKRIDETVSLVRGKIGSTVVLDVLPAGLPTDGKHVVVALTRQKVSLDDEGAKKSLVTVEGSAGPRRIGVITLPSFYRDVGAQMGGEKNFKSASADVAKLIGELKADKADGILVDLRNNGGGSVLEAVALTGLFTGKGPVLQERDAKGKVVVNAETVHPAIWTGPVGVLINRNSASASEIFAAAIQDYGRGVVIGERSFGKGTVQTTVDLDNLVEQKTPLLGEVKMTIAQFFRINGGTTQLHGVLPDVDLAIPTDGRPWGESGFSNPLPWMSVKPAEYTASDAVRRLFPTLQARSEARLATDREYGKLKKTLAQQAQTRKSNVLSLNEAERRRQQKQEGSHAAVIAAAGVEADDRADLDDPARALPTASAPVNAPDVLLAEAVKIVGDETDLVLKARIEARAADAHKATSGGAHEL
jgi:carboxyl-terminal processing protease